MSLHYIIDGYNIINHPLFTQSTSKPAGNQRLALLELIIRKRLSGSPNNKVIVVFDGHLDPENSQALNGHNKRIEVIFSRKESADTRIKKMVEDSSGLKNIIVVSDDKEIRFYVKSLGAKVLSVEEFISPKEKFKDDREEDLKLGLSYSEAKVINEELKKIWLKQ